jgi:hypothetical protein
MSKDWCIDITKSFVNRLCLDVNYLIEDMLAIFKELAKYQPTSWLVDNVDLPTPLFV